MSDNLKSTMCIKNFFSGKYQFSVSSLRLYYKLPTYIVITHLFHMVSSIISDTLNFWRYERLCWISDYKLESIFFNIFNTNDSHISNRVVNESWLFLGTNKKITNVSWFYCVLTICLHSPNILLKACIVLWFRNKRINGSFASRPRLMDNSSKKNK